MLKRKRIMIRLERNGIVINKEVSTFRSCASMLKLLKKQEKQTDPWARIMELKSVPTLVYHRNLE